jgi:hypothetical protein
MRCLLCLNLESAFESRWAEYTEANSLVCYGLSNQFAAYLHVEMERAKIELEEHKLVCLAAANEPSRSSVAMSILPDQPAVVREGVISSAA